MTRRDDFQKSMEQNLAVWGARLATMRAKLSTDAPAAVNAADAKKLEEWQASSDDATARLEALKATRGDQWDVLKLEMARVWYDLDTLLGVAERAMRVHDDAKKAARSNP